MVYIHRHSSILRLDLFGIGFTLHGECRSNSLSTEVLLAATPVNWVSCTGIQKTQVQILAGSQCLFSPCCIDIHLTCNYVEQSSCQEFHGD